MMYQPKTDLFSLLSEIDGVSVYQNKPQINANFPCIVFLVADNKVNGTLDKEIGFQEMIFNIDIYAKTSLESSELLTTLEELLRDNYYRLASSVDLIEQDGYSHIATRFNFIR